MDATEIGTGLPDGWRILERERRTGWSPTLVLQRMVERKKGLRRRVVLVWEDQDSVTLWRYNYPNLGREERERGLALLRAYAMTQVRAEKFMKQEQMQRLREKLVD